MQRKVGKYTLVEQIGAGTAGIVYRAEDRDIGRSVAIKIMKAEYFGSAIVRTQAVERFQREIRAIGRLTHPNIISIHDTGLTSDGLPYLVMQHVEGRGLDLILRDLGGSISAKRAVNLLSQLAAALDYAHRQNVVHRDIKPSNILVTDDDRVYLVDFSTAIVSDATMTPIGQVVGTPQYMAPEVIRGDRAGPAADLYSLGVVAFQMFTGKKPFREGGIASTFTAVLSQSPFSFAELGCSLGASLERALRRCLSKNAEDRFLFAEDFVAACEQALQKGDVHFFSQDAQRQVPDGAQKALIIRPRIENNRRRKSRDFFSAHLVVVGALLLTLLMGTASTFVYLGLDKNTDFARKVRTISRIGYSNDELEKMDGGELIQVIVSSMPQETRVAAVHEAVKRDNALLAQTLVTLLNNSVVEVRREALRGIVEVRSLSKIEKSAALTQALNDAAPALRLFAATELVKTDGKSAMNSLKKQLENERDPLVSKVLEFIISKSG